MSNDLKERAANGDWTSVISDSEVIEAVEKNEPAGTSEVANEIQMSRQGADRRLKILLNDEDTDILQRKKIGASVVWYLDN
jgi:hypothetical protein